MSKPARKFATSRGYVQCRIEQLVDTNDPRVKTAVLACGVQIRFNFNRSRKNQQMTRCPRCTALRRIAEQAKSALAVCGGAGVRG